MKLSEKEDRRSKVISGHVYRYSLSILGVNISRAHVMAQYLQEDIKHNITTYLVTTDSENILHSDLPKGTLYNTTSVLTLPDIGRSSTRLLCERMASFIY